MKKSIIFYIVVMFLSLAQAFAQDSVVLMPLSGNNNLNLVPGHRYVIYDNRATRPRDEIGGTITITCPNAAFNLCGSYSVVANAESISINQINATDYSITNYVLSGNGFFHTDRPTTEIILTLGYSDFADTGGFFFYISFPKIDIHVNSITDTSALVFWNDTSAASSWVVKYKDYVSTTEHTLITSTPNVTLHNLLPSHEYQVRVMSDIDTDYNCGTATKYFFTPFSYANDECINFTELLGNPDITCYNGSFQNPSLNEGFIPERHALITDTTMRDSLCNNALRCIPEGEKCSIRLGDKYNDHIRGGEAISYKLNIDTNNYDLLLIKYAVVLHDFAHSQTEQPRFMIQIIDSSGNVAFPDCGQIDFHAGDNSEWHSNVFHEYINVERKNWTTLGLDLSAYHGQTIYVRFTTRDCAYTWDFGYAYFILKCAQKRITAENCGANIENTFVAPSGFNYSWYKASEPSTVLSTDRSLHVTTAGEYLCRTSFVGSDSCYFIVRANAGERYPKAQFTYTILDTTDCKVRIQFNNSSSVCSDSLLTNPTGERCESAFWDFGDSDTTSIYNPIHSFSGGTFNVRLISMLGGGCSDTATQSLSVSPCIILDTLRTSICSGDTLYYHGAELTESGVYHVNVDSLMFKGTVFLTINPSYDTTIYANICQGQRFESFGFSADSTGIYSHNFQTTQGCDSTITLNLNVTKLNDTILASICSGETYTLNGFNENTEGAYTHFGQNAYGCDSSMTLLLSVFPIYDTIINVVIDSGSVFNEYGITASQDGTYQGVFLNPNGCQGNITVNLLVFRNVPLFIPNAFTPLKSNNNIFTYYTDEKFIKVYRFEIFNRWGKPIFSMSENHHYWDGKYNGTLCEAGTYVYIIDYTSYFTGTRHYEKRGSINLIR